MAKGRMINRSIATDSKFNILGIQAQWLFMRMLPFMDDHGRITGNIFELTMSVIPAQIRGIDDDEIRTLLDHMVQAELIYWEEDVVIQFRGFYKNQKIGHKPANSLYSDKFASKPTPKIAPKSSKRTAKQPKPQTKSKAHPKDLKEVVDYFTDIKIVDPKQNAQKFYDYYMANGWVQGKARKPIKSWKHCVGTWGFTKKEDLQIEKIMFVCPNSLYEDGHDSGLFDKNTLTTCKKCQATLVTQSEFDFRKLTQGDYNV